MSGTLHFSETLLKRVRLLQELGRQTDGLRLLQHLAGFRDLPGNVAEEVQARLAETQLCQGNYGQARRHLKAALCHCPDNARYHALMGRALSEDEEQGDLHLAAAHHRRALEVDPAQPEFLAEAGTLEIRLGNTEEGFRQLRQAITLAPNEPAWVKRLAEALQQENRGAEARLVLLTACFQNPRDHRFQALWQDYRFQKAAAEQQQDAAAARDEEAADEPALLPMHPLPPGGRLRSTTRSRHVSTRSFRPQQSQDRSA